MAEWSVGGNWRAGEERDRKGCPNGVLEDEEEEECYTCMPSGCFVSFKTEQVYHGLTSVQFCFK